MPYLHKLANVAKLSPYVDNIIASIDNTAANKTDDTKDSMQENVQKNEEDSVVSSIKIEEESRIEYTFRDLDLEEGEKKRGKKKEGKTLLLPVGYFEADKTDKIFWADMTNVLITLSQIDQAKVSFNDVNIL